MVKNYHSLSKEKYLHKPQMVSEEEIDQIYQSRLHGVSSYQIRNCQIFCVNRSFS